MAKKKKDEDAEIKTAKEIAEEKNAEEKSESKKSKNEEATKETKTESKNEVPSDLKLTFSSYLLMLGALGWQFLGKVPNPANGKIEKDLLQAQQIIDLLGILEEKTKNNLLPDEKNILDSTLINLRLNYVEEIKKDKEGGK